MLVVYLLNKAHFPLHSFGCQCSCRSPLLLPLTFLFCFSSIWALANSIPPCSCNASVPLSWGCPRLLCVLPFWSLWFITVRSICIHTRLLPGCPFCRWNVTCFEEISSNTNQLSSGPFALHSIVPWDLPNRSLTNWNQPPKSRINKTEKFDGEKEHSFPHEKK